MDHITLSIMVTSTNPFTLIPLPLTPSRFQHRGIVCLSNHQSGPSYVQRNLIKHATLCTVFACIRVKTVAGKWTFCIEFHLSSYVFIDFTFSIRFDFILHNLENYHLCSWIGLYHIFLCLLLSISNKSPMQRQKYKRNPVSCTRRSAMHRG